MPELSIQELVACCKMLTTSDLVPDEASLARLRHANAIAERSIAIAKYGAPLAGSDADDPVSHLDAAREAIAEIYDSFGGKKPDGANSPQLTHIISELAALHNNLNTLSWLVGENQADQDETVPGSFTDADDLFKAMGV